MLHRKDVHLDSELRYGGISDKKHLWRYLTVAKYVSMITTKSLYFSRADLLGDKYEGTYRAYPLDMEDPFTDDNLPHTYQQSACIGKAFVCSFNRAVQENDGMWRLYASRIEGLAIETFSHKLTEHLPLLPSGMEYWFKLIKYKSLIRPYEMAPLDKFDPHDPFFFKDTSFEHEAEARIVIMYDPSAQSIPAEWVVGPPEEPEGLCVPIDLEKAFTSIVLSPDMPFWMQEAVKQVTQLANLSLPVNASEIRFRDCHRSRDSSQYRRSCEN